jgi:hypothetical protein
MTRSRALAMAVVAGLLGLAAWAGFAPVPTGSREALFEIPAGTWARRMAGDPVEILPQRIDLTLGVRDVLVLRNRDSVPQTFGPTVMMPGQSLRLPFEVASTYSFACTAHASGTLDIVVAPEPRTPWQRMAWRAQAAWRRVTAGNAA